MFSSRIISLASVLVATAVCSTAAPAIKPGTTIIQRQYNQTIAKRDTGFNYGGSDVRGVNLGGWLLLEPFITPWLFENLDGSIVDEYTFCQNQDRGAAANALRSHWDSWITEDDFRQIRDAGLNHVRLPIGFWAFDVSGGEPYIQGQKEYLYRAIGWARQYGIKVIIDLHGAPGSQNGFDNSGRRGSANWADDQRNVDRTRGVVQSLAGEFSDGQYYGVVTAIAVLNEPAGFLNDNLLYTARQFNIDAYYDVRERGGLLVIYHDAFQPPSFWNGAFNYPQTSDVMLDHHYYSVFSDAEVRRTWGQHLNAACSYGDTLATAPNWAVVGEWSLAAYDCARWLNGRGVGARYDGSYPGSSYVGVCWPFTGDGSTFSNEYKNFLRDFWDTQTQTFENRGQGWIFWTWKAAPAEWSYQAGLNGGWIPRNPAEHRGYKCS
ncbi:hypothetical protein NliqN6_2110 [Naganishia liquefaciens]|uniref:Glycoside hydrolase family 5 domain-containing protein n=1 Tax=Naganishia liquefaciens TaxID=104408 RepID=A0A8H3TRA1_9TREE|nr:hypothetical protein NliqN6_2110 [Naganishia liquefaciens]